MLDLYAWREGKGSSWPLYGHPPSIEDYRKLGGGGMEISTVNHLFFLVPKVPHYLRTCTYDTVIFIFTPALVLDGHFVVCLVDTMYKQLFSRPARDDRKR